MASSSQRKSTYNALRDAGFSREFARRHDKAGPAEVQELLADIARFSRTADLGRREEQIREAAQDRKAIKVTEIPWYKRTSENLSKALTAKRRELKQGKISSAQYAEIKAEMVRTRQLLQIKAKYGIRALSNRDYAEIDDFFDEIFGDEQDYSDLYGSDED